MDNHSSSAVKHSVATKQSQVGRRDGRIRLRDAAAAFYQAGWRDEFEAIVGVMAEHRLVYKAEVTVRACAEAYSAYCSLSRDHYLKRATRWLELVKYEGGTVGDEIDLKDLPYLAFLKCSWYETCPRPILRFADYHLVVQCNTCHRILHKQVLSDTAGAEDSDRAAALK